jgi:hypothetical protein
MLKRSLRKLPERKTLAVAIIMRQKTKTLTTLSQATTLLVRRTKSMPKSSAKLERESGLRALIELKTGLL